MAGWEPSTALSIVAVAFRCYVVGGGRMLRFFSIPAHNSATISPWEHMSCPSVSSSSLSLPQGRANCSSAPEQRGHLFTDYYFQFYWLCE